MELEHPPKLIYSLVKHTSEQRAILNNRCLGLRVLVIKTGCGWSIPEDQLTATIIHFNFVHGIYYVEFDAPKLYVDHPYFFGWRWGQLLVLKDQSPWEELRHYYDMIRYDERHLHQLGRLWKQYNLV